MHSAITTLTLLLGLLLAHMPAEPNAYLGFDRNVYPGDDKLPLLRKHFAFSGYWLGNPPGEKSNTWAGKRQRMQDAGFGFLLLFNARSSTVLERRKPDSLGKGDGAAAANNARREGFPDGAVIFLDMEEGGRMTEAQRAYIYAWVDTVNASGYRAGVYCSGIPARDDGNVVTALDIKEHAINREIVYWVANDSCTISHGCVMEARDPAGSGVPFASVWQFAQSPRRKFASGVCAKTYDRDGNCYPPGLGASSGIHVDLNTASNPDPSHGRTVK